MSYDKVIFREYDVRGVYNKQFDDAFAYKLGRAFCSFVVKKFPNRDRVATLGHDARLSSPAIVRALEKSFLDSGFEVRKLGLVTTPMSYFSTFYNDGKSPEVLGGIMVTGSHNPPEYNGFKISVGKTTIFGDNIQELARLIERQDFVAGTGQSADFDIFTPYLERYKKEFGEIKNIPIVLDCGNGAAGAIVRRLFEQAGLKPHILFEEPDGRFPNHHPDPTVEENLVALKDKVLKTKSICGIGFDGDADRIGVVDDTGRMVFGDELMALISRFVLSKNPGEKIIGDVKCSDRMYAYIEKYGGKGVMWKTGHSLIKQKVKDDKAPFGGELSGHVFFADRNYGYDDAPYAALRLVEILAQTKSTIQHLLADFPSAFSTPELRIDTTEEKKHSIVSALKGAFENRKDVKVNLLDGIRVSYSDGWALARASNTQPVLVLRFESTSEAGLHRIRREFESVVESRL